MAIASTGLYLSGNIGMLAGSSLASNILQTSLRQGLTNELRGFDGWEVVRRCESFALNEDSLVCRSEIDLYPISNM